MPVPTEASSRALLAALVLLCGLAGGGAAGEPSPREGHSAYREGRFADALEAFAAAERAAGERASAALRYNVALSALRAGQLDVAGAAAARAAESGRSEAAVLAQHLLGNIAFARSEELAAGLVADDGKDPGPDAFDAPIEAAERAAAAWRSAALLRAELAGEEWPEARRNVERALLLLAELRGGKARAEARRAAERAAEPEARELLPGEEDGQAPEEEPGEELEAAAPEPAPAEPAPAPVELAALLERIAEREREKLEQRRARRGARSAAVERDW